MCTASPLVSKCGRSPDKSDDQRLVDPDGEDGEVVPVPYGWVVDEPDPVVPPEDEPPVP